MPRRKPVSAKQKKAELQLARAIKRGDEPAPPPLKPGQKRAPAQRPAQRHNPATSAAAKLESAFIKLDTDFLNTGKLRAAQCALQRPIPPELAAPPAEVLEPSSDRPLTCPKRPKWHYEDTKLMVEKNEEGQFKKWAADTDERLHEWLETSHIAGDDRWGPSYYERNLEVWRQLWRVSEISEILVVLLDSRLPPLHYPPSLQSYLATLRPVRKVILVLTKADVTGPDICALWELYLHEKHPGVRVVTVESYRPKPAAAQGRGRPRYEPHIPPASLQQLVDALREVHAELCEPPQAVKDDPERLAAWKPRAKPDVDWELLLAPQDQRGLKPRQVNEDDDDEGAEKQFLTIGLIGQPNVGKSSLLNALFGTHKVKASKTPGKTKHFQTLFWTPDIRLCDCPGLVMPNYTHLELQVLCGILPIARIPSLPSCVHYASQIIPLERILGLTHPSSSMPAPKDKRTWRPGQQERVAAAASEGGQTWTAMDIMTAFALKNGWVTAKAGRPDVMRAGNAGERFSSGLVVMRALAEGKIRWAFSPPGHQGESGEGIWIGERSEENEAHREWDGNDSGGDESDVSQGGEDSAQSESEEVDEEVGSPVTKPQGFDVGRFGVLLGDESDDEASSTRQSD
ncbi:P-loop containing nucleoside triphosphate hydrolase protein [Auricularia subglabra TFB-10046 SS5]|nr:P-loop containing nucleoside triphosphate hydrolase protein [Auricularia subglabra TFB-10046 SS5]